MRITASALSLNVTDPTASASFLVDHFGFTQDMADDGFVSLLRPDAGFSVIYLRTGLESFQPRSIGGSAGQGTLVVFVVDAIDEEYRRLQNEDVRIVTPIEDRTVG